MSILLKKNISMFTFFIFSIVAIAAGAKLPVEGQKYPDTVGVFVIAVIIAIVANIVWHKLTKAAAKEYIASNTGEGSFDPTATLKEISATVNELLEGFDKETIETICEKLDKLAEDKIMYFVDNRALLLDLLGQSKGAKVLLEFAFAERMINRTWSAASDEHLEESKNALTEAKQSLDIILKDL